MTAIADVQSYLYNSMLVKILVVAYSDRLGWDQPTESTIAASRPRLESLLFQALFFV